MSGEQRGGTFRSGGIAIHRVDGAERRAGQNRRRVAAATEGANYIETVWGRGYVLRDPNGEEIVQVA